MQPDMFSSFLSASSRLISRPRAKDAAALIGKFIFFFVIWAAYMVLLSESPYHVKKVVDTSTDEGGVLFDENGMAYASSNAFGDYGNCVWFVVVTMTTTGYALWIPSHQFDTLFLTCLRNPEL